jgi:hypothetical protein
MRRLLSLLLIVGLAAELLPACTDAEAGDYLTGAGARRSRVGGFEAPTDHYWDFEVDGDDDYLKVANIDALEADDYTVVAVVHFEDITAKDNCIASQYSWATDQWSWALGGDDNTAKGTTCSNNCANSDFNVDPVVLNNTEALLVAMTFDYSGNPGDGDSTLTLWTRKAAGMESDIDATLVGPVIDCTGVFSIGTRDGAEANYSFDGKIYWVAYYASVLTEQNLEDLYDGTKHPATDFTPVLYWDASKAVAGTYTTEVGSYVLTVTGDPVQGP